MGFRIKRWTYSNKKYSLKNIIIGISIFAFFVILALLAKNKGVRTTDTKSIELSNEVLLSYGIIDKNGFKKYLYDIYVKIQKAWSENDIDKARDVLSDGLYNQYKTQILTMTTKNEQNIMSDFKYINAKIPNESSTRCEYCGSEIIKDSTKIVLQRKRKLRQR